MCARKTNEDIVNNVVGVAVPSLPAVSELTALYGNSVGKGGETNKKMQAAVEMRQGLIIMPPIAYPADKAKEFLTA